MPKFYSIAIDGPAGCGKSTVAKQVAADLNFDYVNSGLFYRAIAIYCDQNNINYNDENSFNGPIFNYIKLSWDNGTMLMNDEKIELLRANSQAISHIASVIAQYPSVRAFVNKNILELSEFSNIIVDGRDIGTLVLPDATAKIFLDADVRTRAIRRLKQLSESSNISRDINSVINDIIERDNRDYTRKIAPLAKAQDAYVLDCSDLSIKETVEKIKRFYMRKVTDAEWKD